MRIEPQYMEIAKKLHESCPVADAHLDLAAELFFRKKAGEEHPLRERYLESFREGGVNLVVSSVFLFDCQLPEGALRAALMQIAVLLEEIDKNKEFLLVRTAEDLERALREGRIGILICMEGLDCIGEDIGLLRVFWELGVRGASLTWSRRNALGNGCCKEVQVPGGLSEAGFAAVREMERLGMFLDVSHLNDDGFQDLCRVSSASLAATHSDSRAVASHYRNLSDAQMRQLAARGGVLGLNGCRCIIGCEAHEDALEFLCRHAEHAVSVMGAERVGYGFDFCDALYDAEPKFTFQERCGDCLKGHSHVQELTAALLQRGMDEETVKKIIGGNWIEYFRSQFTGGSSGAAEKCKFC